MINRLYNISKDFLYNEYVVNKKSIRQVANLCKCSIVPIRQRLNEYNIKIRSISEAKTKDVSVKCDICNKEFHIREYKLNLNKHFYCSRQCYNIARSEIYIKENSGNWQGGLSFELYPLGWTKTFREQIRHRDNYKCQECGVHEVDCIRKLHVHHIDYDKNNLASENLISLCNKCHTKTNFNRSFWTIYFQNKIKENQC